MDPKSISSPYLAMMAPSACSSGGPGWGSRGAISAKYRSNPAGEIISNARASASPAFQKACGTPLGLKTRSGTRSASPDLVPDLVPDLDADLTFEHLGVFVLTLMGVQRRGEDARPDRVLDEREGSPALGTPYHETHA